MFTHQQTNLIARRSATKYSKKFTFAFWLRPRAIRDRAGTFIGEMVTVATTVTLLRNPRPCFFTVSELCPNSICSIRGICDLSESSFPGLLESLIVSEKRRSPWNALPSLGRMSSGE